MAFRKELTMINYTILESNSPKDFSFVSFQKTKNLIPPLTPLEYITTTRRPLPRLVFLKRPTNAETYQMKKGARRKSRFWNKAKTGEYMIKRFGRVRGWSWKFLTLTSSYSSGDLSRDWEAFVKRVKRHFKLKSLTYIKVVEMNKKEDLKHLHILLYCPYMKEEWIRAQWYEIHKAYEVDIEFVSFANAKSLAKKMSYMAKYLSKAMVGRFSYSFSFVGGLKRLSLLWRGMVVLKFKYFVDQSFEWLYGIWQEFLTLLKTGKTGSGISNLYDFMIVSTW